MIDSLLEESPQRGAIEGERTATTIDASAAPSSGNSLLASLPIVLRIARRRRSELDSANSSDLVQEVALRLWRWATNHREKSEGMSDDEWKAFAARTAYNEVSRRFSTQVHFASADPDNIPAIEHGSIEGETEIEVFSLVRSVWQGICKMSLRQRRALLLHSQELIIYILRSGISEEELAGVLGLKVSEWYDIRDRLPMTDARIATEMECERKSGRPSSTAGSVKKARHEARVKLEGLIRK